MGYYLLLHRLRYLASWLGAYTPGLLFVEGTGDLGPSPGLQKILKRVASNVYCSYIYIVIKRKGYEQGTGDQSANQWVC